MNTISLLYYTNKDSKDILLKYIKNQNNIVRFIYNRLQENKNLKQKELTILANNMNNIFIDSWFKQSAIYKALELKDKERVIFGGKKLFFDRLKNKITKEEFQSQKLLPLYVVGESSKTGNRKFNFEIIENNKIIFKPECGVKIDIQLPKLRKNYRKILFRLQELAESRQISLTISLDLNKIHITYDESKLAYKFQHVKNRIMSLDLNPNYTGYSIIDWINSETKSIVSTGVISIKELNDKQFDLKQLKVNSQDSRMKYLNNKRLYETYEISKRLINIAKSYNVESFGVEGLDMESSDKHRGSRYNRLVNNMWNRSKLVSNLEKRCNLSGIKFYKLLACYSSFIGNLMNNSYPDCVAASIEINRRCYCYKNRIKPVIFPDFKKSINSIKQSLEELFNGKLLVDSLTSWQDMYEQVEKNFRMRYRVSLESCVERFRVFRLFDRKSLIDWYQFI